MSESPKENMFAHWDGLCALANRRFPDENLADEALLFVAEQLEKDDWKRLRAHNGTSSFRNFLLHVSARLLEDFSRKKFGRVRPNKWIRERGGMWLQLFKLICLERNDDDWAVSVLRHSAPEGRAEPTVREAIKTLRTKVPDCGKQTMPSASSTEVETLPHEGRSSATTRPEASMAASQREAVLSTLTSLCPDENACGEPLTPLADKVMDAQLQLDLTTDDRLLLKLIYWDGLNTSAAGRMLGWTTAKAHGRLRTVLTSMRSNLEAADVYEPLRQMVRED